MCTVRLCVRVCVRFYVVCECICQCTFRFLVWVMCVLFLYDFVISIAKASINSCVCMCCVCVYVCKNEFVTASYLYVVYTYMCGVIRYFCSCLVYVCVCVCWELLCRVGPNTPMWLPLHYLTHEAPKMLGNILYVCARVCLHASVSGCVCDGLMWPYWSLCVCRVDGLGIFAPDTRRQLPCEPSTVHRRHDQSLSEWVPPSQHAFLWHVLVMSVYTSKKLFWMFKCRGGKTWHKYRSSFSLCLSSALS